MPERTALILGSGFTDLVAASDALVAETDYGVPSSAVHRVSLSGQAVLALARHGDAHSLPPHRINYRANIAALRDAGATAIIALNTVGVIGRIRAPGQIAVPDQLLDYTWGREHTFFTGNGAGVEHLEFTEPFATAIRRRVLAAAAAAGVDCLDGGVYAATQSIASTAASMRRRRGRGSRPRPRLIGSSATAPTISA